MEIKDILELIFSKDLDKKLIIEDDNGAKYKVIGVAATEHSFIINIKKELV